MSASDRSHRPRPSIQPYAIYAPGQPPNFPGSFSDLSGAYATPVEAAPMQYSCDECHADTIVQYERNKILNRGPDIIPERGSALPRSNGPSAVIFEAKIPGPGGVLLSDILAFRDCLMHPGAPVLRHTPGTVSVALSVGTSTYFEKVPGNCEHRLITRFNLAWWLAKFLQNDLKNNIQGLYLLSLYTRDGNAWTAMTRYARPTSRGQYQDS